MPFYELENIECEIVTPKHSKAYGELISGEQVELGLLRFKAGEGANTPCHPHEQVLIVLDGTLIFTLDGNTKEICVGQAVHIPPNIPHSVAAVVDTKMVSCKGIVDGVGHRI